MQAQPNGSGLRLPSLGPSEMYRGPGAATITLQYLQSSNVVVRGPVTGRRYAFSAWNRVQSVDRRDARTLLSTRMFRPV
jgi:hypothetical protein